MIEIIAFKDAVKYHIVLDDGMEDIASACADGLRQHGYHIDAFKDVHERKKVYL